MAQDTAHAKQHTAQAHQQTGAKWSGHRTSKAKDGVGALVNRSQVAQDTVHATQHTERAHR